MRKTYANDNQNVKKNYKKHKNFIRPVRMTFCIKSESDISCTIFATSMKIIALYSRKNSRTEQLLHNIPRNTISDHLRTEVFQWSFFIGGMIYRTHTERCWSGRPPYACGKPGYPPRGWRARGRDDQSASPKKMHRASCINITYSYTMERGEMF